jgi:hypothetical protein
VFLNVVHVKHGIIFSCINIYKATYKVVAKNSSFEWKCGMCKSDSQLSPCLSPRNKIPSVVSNNAKSGISKLGSTFKCIICDASANPLQNAFRCEGYHQLSHWSCADLDDSLAMLSSEKYRKRILLTCSPCSVSDLINDLSSIKKLEERFCKVECALTSLNLSKSTVVDAGQNVRSATNLINTDMSFVDHSTPGLQVSIAEALEKEKRKSNVIIFNIPECGNSLTDSASVKKL